MDNTDLIQRAQQGDATAFEQLLGHCYDIIYRFALKWCGNETDAEDITQQACVKLAKSINQFRFESAFTSWLYRLVINCAKDWQRSQSRHQKDNIDTPHEYTGPNNNENAIYLTQTLQKVNSMGEGFKETLLLVIAEGRSHAEAAAILDVKEGTISWRIHEIRKTLGLWVSEEEKQ